MRTNSLKIAFSEIIQGFNETDSKYGLVFIKHFTTLDLGRLEIESQRFYNQAQQAGIPTVQEQEQYIKKEGLWTEEDEINEIDLTTSLSNMKLTYSKLFKEFERKEYKKAIEQIEIELNSLKIKKQSFIGDTCESYTAKKFNDFCIFNAFYSDSVLSKKRFKNLEFDELDREELHYLINLYSQNINKFDQSLFKKLGLTPFFLNLFYLAEDDPVKFYGKAVINLTFYQAELFSYGRYFKPLLNEYKDKLPEDILNDPDKLIEAVTAQKNADELLKKTSLDENQKTSTSLVGASRKEIEKLGGNVIDLGKTAQKHGGLATFEDIIKEHGI